MKRRIAKKIVKAIVQGTCRSPRDRQRKAVKVRGLQDVIEISPATTWQVGPQIIKIQPTTFLKWDIDQVGDLGSPPEETPTPKVKMARTGDGQPPVTEMPRTKADLEKLTVAQLRALYANIPLQPPLPSTAKKAEIVAWMLPLVSPMPDIG